MTLEQQVHDLEIRVKRLEELEKNRYKRKKQYRKS